jgi:hypothetical protein
MRKLNFRTIAALGLTALAFAGCEHSSKLTAPQSSDTAFRTASTFHSIVVKAPEAGQFGTLGDDQSTSAVIGAEGGQINIGPDVLVVPAGTVDAPTVFTMTIAGDNVFHVSLSATSEGAPEGSNDVGSAGFKSPVFLYYDLGTSPDPDYFVAWAAGDDFVPIASRLEGSFVVGQLSHFSDYYLAQ